MYRRLFSQLLKQGLNLFKVSDILCNVQSQWLRVWICSKSLTSLEMFQVKDNCKFMSWLKFQMLILLAHLSRRLTGGLLVYPCSGIRRLSVRQSSIQYTHALASVVCPSVSRPSVHIFKHLLLRNHLANHVEPPWVGGTKVCSRHLGHMTKMAAMPEYGKNTSKIFFSGTSRPISTKLGM